MNFDEISNLNLEALLEAELQKAFLHQIHLQNMKLKQYIPCTRFVKHLVGTERQWAAGRCSSEE